MLTIKEVKLGGDLDWHDLIKNSSTTSFFQTKEWLKLWVKHWGKEGRVVVYAVFDNNELIGIAPFYFSSNKVNILGAPDPSESGSLSDFGDIIIKSGREKEVWEAVLSQISPGRSPFGHLPGVARRLLEGEFRIELNFIREDSPSFKILQELGGKTEEIDVAPYIDLPSTWDEYLLTLDRHNRHELRRKIRKLDKEGIVKVIYNGESSLKEAFFRLMSLSSEQKRDFLTEAMRKFLRDVIETFWNLKALNLCFLQLGGENIAVVLLFSFKDEVLLYNSGFDARFSHLSPGFLLKALMIKEAIEQGKKRFDFLRGKERYKYDLGGRERKLYKIKFD